MLNFSDRLIAAIEQKRSCVVVGLDPQLEHLPPEHKERAQTSTEEAAAAILDFNQRILDAVAEHAVAVKPQSAFYEALGWQGVRAYADTIRAAHERGLLVIGDVKRGDIGSTAEAYARGHFDQFDTDAVTVNPYLGVDGIAPFLQRAEKGKGIFVLVKTSNPSSGELQDIDSGGARVYERVADLVERWGEKLRGKNGYSAVGAVVGATYPEAAGELRKRMPHTFFLVPGYGAQGGTAADCRPNFDTCGLGAVVNASRSIIFAYGRTPAAGRWEAAVAEATAKMKEELERVRSHS